MLLLIGCLFYVLLSVALYVFLSESPPHISGFARVGQKRTVLLLTSHPDDECMFFTPTIVRLLGNGHSLRVLCLSSGNYDGLGDVRKNELRKSCALLGLEEDCVEVIEDDQLPDDPEHTWDPERVCFYVYEQMRNHGINTVITFDEHGVSGHYNHKQTHRALWRALFQDTLPRGLEVYVLKTTNLFRKYISILDLPFSLFFANIIFILNWEEICLGHRAMHEHRSQMVWFRKLYLLFSRYMIVNTLEPLALSRPRKVAKTSPSTVKGADTNE